MADAVNEPENGTAMSNADDGSSTDGGEFYYPKVHRKDNYTADEETDSKLIYDIRFYNGIKNETIRTTIAQATSDVDEWIEDVKTRFGGQIENENLIVGLDIEWVRLSETDKRNKVAVLQLCLAHQCLIFQFYGLGGKSKSKKLQKIHIPKSLVDFLNDKRILFVGSGIDQDARRLRVDHELTVARSEELGGLADHKLGREDLYKAGLKDLMVVVLGQELPKDSWITLSRWDIGKRDDVGTLTYEQIKHACLDAYASFKLGMELMRRRPQTVNKGFNGYPQKDFNKAPQETYQGQGPKKANQARGFYKESNRSKPTLMDYWR